MEHKIKNIISPFIRVPAEEISVDTIIDRSAVNSSITLHRMYAKLAEEGVVVEDYVAIKNFGTLVNKVKGNGGGTILLTNEVESNPGIVSINNYQAAPAVGIDIEEIGSLPRVGDFREDEFYKMNFASSEIAYCILQSNPYASFAGLFAAKEAIVKANNSIRNKPFNTIVIEHQPEGKPVYPGFHISISHTDSMAIAVALPAGADLLINKNADAIALSTVPSNDASVKLLCVLSFIISLVALLIALL